jgi:hypothetical protein
MLRKTLVLAIGILILELVTQLRAEQSGVEIILQKVDRAQAAATIHVSLTNTARHAIYLETDGVTKSAALHSVFVECLRNNKWFPLWPFADLPPSGITELRSGRSIEHSFTLPDPIPSPGRGLSPLPQGKCRVKARFFRSENQWRQFMSDTRGRLQPEVAVSEPFAFPKM